jgi:hypothetical protein
MEQRRVGHEPLRSSQRRRSFEVFFLAVLLLMLMAFVSGPCGERGAVSSRGPRWWKAGGQARRAGAPCGPVERVWAGGEGAERPRPTPVRAAQSTRFPWERAQSTGFPPPSTGRVGQPGPIPQGCSDNTTSLSAKIAAGGGRG